MLLLKPILKLQTYLTIVFVLVIGSFSIETSKAQTITQFVLDEKGNFSPAQKSSTRSNNATKFKDLSKVVQIEFDETGQMISAPPSGITDNTMLLVTVDRREATYQNRVVAAHNRYLTALINLNKLDPKAKKPEPAILSSLGLDSAANDTAQKILSVIKSRLATQILKLLKDPKKALILSKYVDVAEEKTKLNKFVIDPLGVAYTQLFNLVHIPDIYSLVNSAYLFHIKSDNENGLVIKPKCDTTITFSTDTTCCSLTYNTYFFKINDLGNGPVKFDFELRETNNLFKQLIWQIRKDSDITRYMQSHTGQSLDIHQADNENIDAITKKIDSILNFSYLNRGKVLIPDSSLAKLKKWIELKEKKKPDLPKPLAGSVKKDKKELSGTTNQATNLDSVKLYEDALVKDQNIVDNFTKIINSLDITYINSIIITTLKPMKNSNAVAWLLQFAWLTQGQYLTANPLKNSPNKPTDGLNKKLDSLKKDSIFLAKRLTKDENISKSPGHTNFDDLTKDYDSVLTQARKTQDSLAVLRDTLKKLKSSASGNAQNINLNDSLLYSGFFYVNHQREKSDCWDWWLMPNKPYYVFTRNHNALEDYQLMGRDPVRQINEKQKMVRLVQNSKKPGNIFLDETITAVSPSDMLANNLNIGSPTPPPNNVQQKSSTSSTVQFQDFKSMANENSKFQSIMKTFPSIKAMEENYSNIQLILKNYPAIKLRFEKDINKFKSKQTADSLNLMKLFSAYEQAKKTANAVLAPYKNGILTLPVQPMRDTTANYYTNKLVNGTEIFPKNTIAYVIDSAVDKTLKKQKLAFSYTVDKLFRFRLKAGIAYSWLETRNYTITPATNTATYVNNYVDLGPTIGIQIFTSKLDVQSSRVLPTGIYPFGYVGYIYSSKVVSNFLLGAGWEVFSGIAVTGGVHFGASQELTVVEGNLQTKGYFKGAPFVSVTIGIEALSNIFSATSSLGPAFKIP